MVTQTAGGAWRVTVGRENDPGPESDTGVDQSPLDPAEREELITSNLGLAHQLARRFLHRGEPLDDLVQVASVALGNRLTASTRAGVSISPRSQRGPSSGS